jgi:hypothetical protein
MPTTNKKKTWKKRSPQYKARRRIGSGSVWRNFMMRNPDFIRLFLDAIRLDYDTGGVKKLIPYLLIGCFLVGALIVYLIPENKPIANIFTLVAALITAQGIILAMSMQTSGIILNNISQGEFCSFLRRNQLLGYYMLLVQLIQMINIISLISLLATAVVIMVELKIIFFKIIFATAIGFFLYAVRWAWGTTTIVRDLIHYRSIFEQSQELPERNECYPETR